MISERHNEQDSSAGFAVSGTDGGGRSSDWVVDAFRCRGKDDEDHHSRNLSRNIDVGRIRFKDDARRGRSRVRRKFIGDWVSDGFPATSLGGTSGFFCQSHRVA